MIPDDGFQRSLTRIDRPDEPAVAGQRHLPRVDLLQQLVEQAGIHQLLHRSPLNRAFQVLLIGHRHVAATPP